MITEPEKTVTFGKVRKDHDWGFVPSERLSRRRTRGLRSVLEALKAEGKPIPPEVQRLYGVDEAGEPITQQIR